MRAVDKKPFGIIILDGWGLAPAWGGNAISQAQTKCFSQIWKKYPSTSLLASGQAVGLPTNSPGNSEAGHLNIGAGHVVHQDITLIDQTISDGSFFQNKVLFGAIEHAEKNRSRIHVLGLLSKTGTHSHIRHLYALLNFFKQNKFDKVFIHLFSDGRDSDPMSGLEMVMEAKEEINKIGVGTIASISGRFFSMDRDNRWGRIARFYNLLVKGEGNSYDSIKSAFSSAYASGQTDEFIEPRLIANKIQGKELVSSGDSIVLFNFRSDRSKELTKAFLDDHLPEFPDRKKLSDLYFASFVIFEGNNLAKKVFVPRKVDIPISKVWSEQGLSQFHTAETEKFPHVTYFFNGGNEKPYPGEKRLLVPSPKDVRTYDFKPKMSSYELTESILNVLKYNSFDAYVINFANADMVGHTGNLEATVQAVEAVDRCLAKILTLFAQKDGTAVILSDHGNAEQMVNPHTGEPDTEHTTNPVPFILFNENLKSKDIKLRSDGILASVAPTVLELMGLPKPGSMVNQSLIIKENIK